MLKKNESIGIIGRSGSGKSTFSKVISGVISNYSGSFFYKNKLLKNYNYRERKNINKKIQLVFQNPETSLNPKQSISDCLKEVLYVFNFNGNYKNKIISVLNSVDLNKFFYNKYPHELSGGEKQRICIARVLLTNPEIIIFDESVSALDVNTQSQILNLIKKLYIKNNFTIIFISHDIGSVSFLCDKLIVIDNGKVLEKINSKKFINKNLKKIQN